MNFPADTASFLLSLIVLAAVGAVGFLIKKAFTDLTEGVRGLGSKIDNVQTTLGVQNTDIALLAQRVGALERVNELAGRS